MLRLKRAVGLGGARDLHVRGALCRLQRALGDNGSRARHGVYRGLALDEREALTPRIERAMCHLARRALRGRDVDRRGLLHRAHRIDRQSEGKDHGIDQILAARRGQLALAPRLTRLDGDRRGVVALAPLHMHAHGGHGRRIEGIVTKARGDALAYLLGRDTHRGLWTDDRHEPHPRGARSLPEP